MKSPDYRADVMVEVICQGSRREWESVLSGASLRYRGCEALPVHLEEHCQECAAPGCYSTCGLYEPSKEVGCRRFVFGIVTREDPECWTGTHSDIVFKRWARLKAKSVSLTSPRVWHHGFLLQMHIAAKASFEFNAALTLSASPWTTGMPELQVPLVLTAGTHEIYISPGQLTFLRNASAVEASFCFNDEVPDGVRLFASHFVESVTGAKGEAFGTPKLVCLDLDGTLWRGSVGEVVAGPIPHQWLRRLLEDLRRRRIRFAVVSRAEPNLAVRNLEVASLLPLFDEICCGVSSKAETIHSLRSTLGLQPAEVVFVDDDCYEREEVRALCPGITVLDETRLAGLATDPILSAHSVVSQCPRPIESTIDRSEFLNTLDAALVVRRPEGDDLIRCWELLHRTNRLHCAEWRPSLAQMADAIARKDTICLCRMVFGPHY